MSLIFAMRNTDLWFTCRTCCCRDIRFPPCVATSMWRRAARLTPVRTLTGCAFAMRLRQCKQKIGILCWPVNKV